MKIMAMCVLLLVVTLAGGTWWAEEYIQAFSVEADSGVAVDTGMVMDTREDGTILTGEETTLTISSSTVDLETYYLPKDTTTMSLCGHNMELTQDNLLELPSKEIVMLFSLALGMTTRYMFMHVSDPAFRPAMREIGCEELEGMIPVTMEKLREREGRKP